jgi:hypothetical protein
VKGGEGGYEDGEEDGTLNQSTATSLRYVEPRDEKRGRWSWREGCAVPWLKDTECLRKGFSASALLGRVEARWVERVASIQAQHSRAEQSRVRSSHACA